ncbi:sister chromatid cohesion protein PDS5 homolog C-like [Bidens hawaiensis]|uniref:sister chromatid cohesion protein PDS5 homolog C-like n=1 Tax=Bidens hawaiensis TaxID=980011 RepID=UPI00404AD19E
MGSSDPDFEHRRQLKVAGELLSEPPASVDDLLHILDQLDKLLQMVEQSPKEIMKEALVPSTRALVSGSLLEHPNMDVRVSVASCLCELTKITAPEQPYCDEEMRGVFRCIVSVLDNLSDKSCRYFDKMVAILDNVAKVRACALMLDIDNELVVRLFEHFLNSVRDHHRKNVCSLMADIMVVVLLESEEISPVILRTLFASVKNNVGVLPVARKLGEEVFIRCADKLRPYIDKTVATLGGLLVDYSPLLTSILDGEANLEHKDESASVQSNVFDTPQSTVPLDDATQVNTREEMVTEKAGNVSDTQLMVVEGAVDQSVSSLTSKLDTTNSNVASKPDTNRISQTCCF